VKFVFFRRYDYIIIRPGKIGGIKKFWVESGYGRFIFSPGFSVLKNALTVICWSQPGRANSQGFLPGIK